MSDNIFVKFEKQKELKREAVQQLATLHAAVTRVLGLTATINHANDVKPDKGHMGWDISPSSAFYHGRDQAMLYIAGALTNALAAAPATGEVTPVWVDVDVTTDADGNVNIKSVRGEIPNGRFRLVQEDLNTTPPPVPVGIDPADVAEALRNFKDGPIATATIAKLVLRLYDLITAAGEQGPVVPVADLIAALQAIKVRGERAMKQGEKMAPRSLLWHTVTHNKREAELALAPHRAAPAAADILKAHDKFVATLKAGCEPERTGWEASDATLDPAPPDAKPDATEPDSDRVMAQKRISERLATMQRKRQAQIELEIGADATEPVCETCGDSKEIPTNIQGIPLQFSEENKKNAKWWKPCPDCTPAPPTTEQRAGYAAHKGLEFSKKAGDAYCNRADAIHWTLVVLSGEKDTEVRAWLDAPADGKERGE